MLALNPAHDISMGKRSGAGARKYFAKAAAGAIAGTMDALHAEAELQFRNRYGRSRYDGILRRNEEANPHSLIGGEYP